MKIYESEGQQVIKFLFICVSCKVFILESYYNNATRKAKFVLRYSISSVTWNRDSQIQAQGKSFLKIERFCLSITLLRILHIQFLSFIYPTLFVTPFLNFFYSFIIVLFVIPNQKFFNCSTFDNISWKKLTMVGRVIIFLYLLQKQNNLKDFFIQMKSDRTTVDIISSFFMNCFKYLKL